MLLAQAPLLVTARVSSVCDEYATCPLGSVTDGPDTVSCTCGGTGSTTPLGSTRKCASLPPVSSVNQMVPSPGATSRPGPAPCDATSMRVSVTASVTGSTRPILFACFSANQM